MHKNSTRDTGVPITGFNSGYSFATFALCGFNVSFEDLFTHEIRIYLVKALCFA